MLKKVEKNDPDPLVVFLFLMERSQPKIKSSNKLLTKENNMQIF